MTRLILLTVAEAKKTLATRLVLFRASKNVRSSRSKSWRLEIWGYFFDSGGHGAISGGIQNSYQHIQRFRTGRIQQGHAGQKTYINLCRTSGGHGSRLARKNANATGLKCLQPQAPNASPTGGGRLRAQMTSEPTQPTVTAAIQEGTGYYLIQPMRMVRAATFFFWIFCNVIRCPYAPMAFTSGLELKEITLKYSVRAPMSF
jgi:hypothetical protein